LSERKSKPVSLGEAMEDFLAEKEWTHWTEEQWREHDARVAAEREAAGDELAAERNRRREKSRRVLVERGFPLDKLRALEAKVYTDAVQHAQEYLESGRRILVLSGGRGVGKTMAAVWWGTQAHPAPPELECGPARFIDAPSLARWPRYDDDRMRQLEMARALVVDDLGLEYDDQRGAFVSLIGALVNARYSNMLPTLITTNMQAGPFKARYQERVADRIREVGDFVEIKGESLRGGNR